MKWSQSPVLPWAQRAYETCLSAGSTAVLAHGHQTGAPTRSCTELASIPNSQGWSDLSRTGLLFPINHTPVGAPGLAPERLSDLKSLGSAVASEARRRELVGMKG